MNPAKKRGAAIAGGKKLGRGGAKLNLRQLPGSVRRKLINDDDDSSPKGG